MCKISLILTTKAFIASCKRWWGSAHHHHHLDPNHKIKTPTMFVIVCEAAAQGLEAKSPPPRILPKPRGRFPSKSGSLYNLILKILKKDDIFFHQSTFIQLVNPWSWRFCKTQLNFPSLTSFDAEFKGYLFKRSQFVVSI